MAAIELRRRRVVVPGPEMHKTGDLIGEVARVPNRTVGEPGMAGAVAVLVEPRRTHNATFVVGDDPGGADQIRMQIVHNRRAINDLCSGKPPAVARVR